MKQLIHIFQFTLLFFVTQNIFSQTNNLELISSAGNTMSSNGIQLNWSLGEIATETYENSGIKLTQGFHQGNLIISSLPNYLEFANLSVYPNPTSDIIIVDIQNFKPSQNTQYQILTIKGKCIKNGNLAKKTMINFSSLISGTYILKINNVKAYKIIKQ